MYQVYILSILFLTTAPTTFRRHITWNYYLIIIYTPAYDNFLFTGVHSNQDLLLSVKIRGVYGFLCPSWVLITMAPCIIWDGEQKKMTAVPYNMVCKMTPHRAIFRPVFLRNKAWTRHRTTALAAQEISRRGSFA